MAPFLRFGPLSASSTPISDCHAFRNRRRQRCNAGPAALGRLHVQTPPWALSRFAQIREFWLLINPGRRPTSLVGAPFFTPDDGHRSKKLPGSAIRSNSDGRSWYVGSIRCRPKKAPQTDCHCGSVSQCLRCDRHPTWTLKRGKKGPDAIDRQMSPSIHTRKRERERERKSRCPRPRRSPQLQPASIGQAPSAR